MTTTSAVHAFMTALVDTLAARLGLDGVQVASGHLGADSAPESIQLTHTPGEQEWGAIGRLRREERFRVKGLAWVTKPGAGEAVIRTARERAFGLLAELEDALRLDPTVNATVRVAALVSYELDQGASPQGRWCQLDFEVEASRSLPT